MTNRSWSIVAPPAGGAVTINEAIAHSYIPEAEDTGLIVRLLEAAQAEFEDLTNAACVTQTIEESFAGWPVTPHLSLSRWPLTAVEEIRYLPEVGEEVALSGSVWRADTIAEPGRVWLRSGQQWPTTALERGPSVTVRYRAGWALGATPAEIRSLILLAFGNLYENREAVVLQPGVTVAILPHVKQRILNWRRVCVPDD